MSRIRSLFDSFLLLHSAISLPCGIYGYNHTTLGGEIRLIHILSKGHLCKSERKELGTFSDDYCDTYIPTCGCIAIIAWKRRFGQVLEVTIKDFFFFIFYINFNSISTIFIHCLLPQFSQIYNSFFPECVLSSSKKELIEVPYEIFHLTLKLLLNMISENKILFIFSNDFTKAVIRKL